MYVCRQSQRRLEAKIDLSNFLAGTAHAAFIALQFALQPWPVRRLAGWAPSIGLHLQATQALAMAALKASLDQVDIEDVGVDSTPASHGGGKAQTAFCLITRPRLSRSASKSCLAVENRVFSALDYLPQR